jgi:hypothetical protein
MIFFMRAAAILLCGMALLINSGCESTESMPRRVRERFAAPEPKTRVFDADARAVFEAAQLAVRRLDFQVSRAAFAQGIVKGYSRLQPGDTFDKARQYTIDVRITPLDDKRIELAVILREQAESASFSGATDIPLHEHALYDSYFAAFEQALREKAGATR